MCVNMINVSVTSRTTGDTRYILAPCGKCVECLKRRQNDWKLRICHECGYWSHVYFFTLTYSPETCLGGVFYPDEAFCKPLFTCTEKWWFDSGQYEYPDLVFKSSACKVDVQKWIKRMREDMTRIYYSDSRWPCKYFICAEYGPNPRGTKRPHYHGILMCNEPKHVVQPYFDAWRSDFGRIDLQEVGIGREDKSSVANYISKYCAKGCFNSRLEDIENGLIERAWSIMSKNIGHRWYEDMVDHYVKHVPNARDVPGDWTMQDVDDLFHSTHGLELPFWSEIDNLIKNYRVYDGNNFSYRMPRYYYERMFCVKKTFENVASTNVPDVRFCPCGVLPKFAFAPAGITYKSKIRKDTRYVHENFLSVAIAYRLRQFADSRDILDRERCKNDYGMSDVAWFRSKIKVDKASLAARKCAAESSLSGFYTTNMWNHREFDE